MRQEDARENSISGSDGAGRRQIHGAAAVAVSSTASAHRPVLRWSRALTLGCLAAVLLTGCTTRMGPAPNSGFLDDPARMTPQPERFPFDVVWRDTGANQGTYSKVFVRRVDTDHLIGVDWTQEQPATEQSQKVRLEANGLAKRFWDEMRNAFYFDPNRRLQIVEKAEEGALVLEMAIIRVVLDSFGRGSVAVEGRVRNGGSGEVFVIFKDQETGNRKKIIDRWALELVELVNTPPDFKVKRR